MAPPRTKAVELEINNKVKPPVKKDNAPRKYKATTRITLWFKDDIDTIEVGKFYGYQKMQVQQLGKNKVVTTALEGLFGITDKNECISKSPINNSIEIISKYLETELIVSVVEEKQTIDTTNKDVIVNSDSKEEKKPGICGRVAGSRNKNSYLREALGPMVCDTIVAKIKERINAGDMPTIMWAADKIYVAPKDDITTFFDIGPIKTMGNINDAMERVIIGGTTGELTHNEVQMIVDVLERKRKFIFENRLQVMLDAMKMKNENLNIAEVMKFYE